MLSKLTLISQRSTSLYIAYTRQRAQKAHAYTKGDYIIISALRYTYILVAKDLYYKQILPHYPRLDGTIIHRNTHIGRYKQNYKNSKY